MPITLCSFENARCQQGAPTLYRSRVRARARGSLVLRSDRETIQPNQTDLQYWAQGLTPV